MKGRVLFRGLLCGLGCLALNGCFYLAAERNGAFFPSTYDIWNAKDKYWFPPTAGGVMYLAGCRVPYVGPVIFLPSGLTIHMVESCAIAPAYDIVLMPYDLCKRPEYNAKACLAAEKQDAEITVHNRLDEALNDGRYLCPSNTIQYQALSDRLAKCSHDALTTNQIGCIVSAVKHNPQMTVALRGVVSQLRLEPDDLEWFVVQTTGLFAKGYTNEATVVAEAICRSVNVTDEQYDRLAKAGCSPGPIEISRKRRAKYRQKIETERQRVEEARRRKAEEEARIRAFEEAERKRVEEKRRREEEYARHYKELDPFVEALFSTPNEFHKALARFDDRLLRDRWVGAIYRDEHCRKVKKEYLLEILHRLDEKHDPKDWALRKAVLRQKALGAETVVELYKTAHASNDNDSLYALTLNPAIPDSLLEKVYLDPKHKMTRLEAARSRAFRWPDDATRKAFISRSNELSAALRERRMTAEEYENAVEALLTEMLPPQMPKWWRRCLRRW